MTGGFIVLNQHGHYWGRSKRWVSGAEPARVAVFKFIDEAANTAFELSAKDIDLRCETRAVELADGKLGKLPVSAVPVPDEETASAGSSEQDKSVQPPSSA